MPNNVTEKTHELVQKWIAAKNNVAQLQGRLNTALCEQAAACNDLGKWLVPEGQNNEPFNIWFGSGILQATRFESGEHTVVWRKEPDGKDRLEFGV